MALYHLTVSQIRRSAGQSAIAAAAYRAGECLYSDYYGEYSDYTRKGGVICSEILLPPHAPLEYQDRATLWNTVEQVEKHKKAQLAYSFDIALQNELSMEENIALAREFVQRCLVDKGMVADFAVHAPDKEDGGIPNPHFHVMTTMRPINPDGTWGQKQRREYVLDDEGNRVLDRNGKPMFNAVPTTDWGSPETLEEWREAWCRMVNEKFAKKGLDVRIDHRSYVRQGIDLIPTVHEGPTVRQMEAKGIRTDKGELNRWIKATNRLMLDIKKKIKSLFGWISEVKEELSKPMIPKPDGSERPLGIPTVKDRIVQMATKIAIEPVFEADFRECSYGFRPKRSAKQALEVVRKACNNKGYYVVDADIEKFFDNVNQGKLMKLVEQRISDRRILKLIKQWLVSGVLYGNVLTISELGTSQGSVISPLLANIYLNTLDRLWEKYGHTHGILVRYADDTVIICKNKKSANHALNLLQYIMVKLDLKLHPVKTKIVSMWDGKEGLP